MSKPQTGTGIVVATKSDICSLELLGGQTFQGVGFTRDQIKNLQKMYGFQDNPVPKGTDIYSDHIHVNIRHKEKVIKILQERTLEFSMEENTRNVIFHVNVPRDSRALEINRNHIPELINETYTVRSWDTLHELDVQATNFINTGSIRNMFRHADSDGLRVMAFLSRFCEPGEDPVQLIAGVLADQGYDVGDVGDDVCEEEDEED